MIKGLAITPPVNGRISIGRVVDKNGKRQPKKDDQFTNTTQIQARDGWLPHPLDEALRQEVQGKKLRSIPVNLPFNDPDLKISLRQLRMFLNEASPDQPLDVPLKALVYLVGECNYGGRVTDGHDRRTLMTILTDEDGGPFHVNVMDDAYAFSPSKNFFAPPEGDYESYLEYFKSLPIAVEPEVFGLHANADITKDQGETDLILDSILSTQGNASSGGGKSKDEVLAEVAAQHAEELQDVSV